MTLCQADRSTLLIIDPQARLIPAIHEGDGVVRRLVQLATTARELGIPVIGTEENPDGLGPNVFAVRALCDRTLAKFFFSAVSEPGFLEQLPAGRETLVVAGCEAHVCVMQTALSLRELGRRVVVVADAVGSRRAADREAALRRMAADGVELATSEMVVFEWLRRAPSPEFRELLPLLK